MIHNVHGKVLVECEGNQSCISQLAVACHLVEGVLPLRLDSKVQKESILKTKPRIQLCILRLSFIYATN